MEYSFLKGKKSNIEKFSFHIMSRKANFSVWLHFTVFVLILACWANTFQLDQYSERKMYVSIYSSLRSLGGGGPHQGSIRLFMSPQNRVWFKLPNGAGVKTPQVTCSMNGGRWKWVAKGFAGAKQLKKTTCYVIFQKRILAEPALHVVWCWGQLTCWTCSLILWPCRIN